MGKRGPAPKRGDVEWTAPLAYAVGLLATDGCLSPDGRHIDFTSKDVELIETFRQCLNLNNRITTKIGGFAKPTIAYHVQFGDVILYRWLLSIGMTPNKSKTIGALDIPDEYFFDFLRGSLDGDGTISAYPDPVYPNSQRLYVRFCSGSPAHLQWLQKRIETLLGLRGYVNEWNREFALIYAKQESSVLLNAIYYTPYVPCLRRKREIAEPFLTSHL